MVWLSIWLNLLIEILFHSLVYLGNFGIYVMYSPHFLACFCRFLSGVYAMEWLEARARSCSPGEEAMGGSCGLWREAHWGRCGLWRKARRGNFICVRGSKVGRGAFSLLGPFYVPGCVVPLLVGV